MGDVFFHLAVKAVRLAVLLPAVLVALGLSGRHRTLRAVALAILTGATGGALLATVLWLAGIEPG